MPTYKNNGNQIHFYGKGGIFRPGETIPTPLLLDHLDGVVRTNDEPAYRMLKARSDMVFAGAGEQTKTFVSPQLIRTILVSPGVDCEVFLNTKTTNYGLRLRGGKDYFLQPNGLVEKLIIQTSAAGTVVIEEVGTVTGYEANDAYTVVFGGENVIFAGQGILWG